MVDYQTNTITTAEYAYMCPLEEEMIKYLYLGSVHYECTSQGDAAILSVTAFRRRAADVPNQEVKYNTNTSHILILYVQYSKSDD